MSFTVLSPDGQPVQALTQDQVSDFLRQGYRLPAPKKDEAPAPVPTPGFSPAGTQETVLVDLGRTRPVRTIIADTEAKEPGAVFADSVDLTKATLAQLVAIEDVGTARAKKVRALAQAGNLTLDTLQSEVGEVDWVSLYQAGRVTWPGGLTKVEETEKPEGSK